MADDANSTGKPFSPFAAMPPEWIGPVDAVALVVEVHTADPAEVARALAIGTGQGAIRSTPDFPAYRAADPGDHVWPIGEADDLGLYYFEPHEIDWIAGTVRVFKQDTTRSMFMAVLLNRADALAWAASSPLVRRLPQRRDPERSQEKRGRGGVRVTPQVAAAKQALKEWLVDDGVPAPSDRMQAKLEQRFIAHVEAAGGSTSPSRARVYVQRAIALRRKETGQAP